MSRFKDSGRDRGRGGFGGGRDSREKTMFKTTCGSCGKPCEVPFTPKGDRPVYCRDCFKKQGGGDSRFGGGDRNRTNFTEKRMFSATCGNCGNSCEVPFRPTGDKPVYCSNCFEKMGGRSASHDQGQKSSAQSDLAEQLKSLNIKLDAILRVLVPTQKAVAVKKEKPKSEPKKTEKKTKAKKATKKLAKK